MGQSAQMSLSVIFNHFPLRLLSHQPIWVLNLLLNPAGCVCVCVCLYTPLHFSGNLRVHVCVRLECVLSLIHRELAEQTDTALGFLAICKSAVTVMRAAQRRRRCGKCQHVTEEWHRTLELGMWGPSASTQQTHDKAKLVQTRIIPLHTMNRKSHKSTQKHTHIHTYKHKKERLTKRCLNMVCHIVVYQR